MLRWLVIIGTMFIGDLLWWRWADARLRCLPRSAVWRVLLGFFSVAMAGYLLFTIGYPPLARQSHRWMPAWMLGAFYIWHLFILPILLLLAFGRLLIHLPLMLFRRKTEPAPEPVGLSRRDVLAAAAVALPPLFLGGLTIRSVLKQGEFRIRSIDIPLAGLPPDLDGMTIAHVSDLHIGRFTRPHSLPRIIDATNALRADIVAFTGDLIDLTLYDLPSGIDFLRRLDPHDGLFVVEGNHDLIDNPREFETRMRMAGMPLLLEELALTHVRGRPVQVLGIPWGRSEDQLARMVGSLARRAAPDAFTILLSHHPHAFDPAVAAGIPLTLAGHTHGGQLMLNERLGAGPAMYRYWSGLYRRGQSALVVSNGVGNWFPLRINAPAEIIRITLRAAAAV